MATFFGRPARGGKAGVDADTVAGFKGQLDDITGTLGTAASRAPDANKTLVLALLAPCSKAFDNALADTLDTGPTLTA